MSKNIIMSEHTDSRYEELYPKTVASQISDVYSKSETSNLFLPKSGGSMGGVLDMNGNKITNLAYPTESLDSANKKYVDDSQMFEIITVKSGKLNNSGNKFNDINMGLTKSQYGRLVGVIVKMSFSSTTSTNSFSLTFGTGSYEESFFYCPEQKNLSNNTFSVWVHSNYYYQDGFRDYVNPYYQRGNHDAQMANFSRQNVADLYLRSNEYNGTVTGDIKVVLLR